MQKPLDWRAATLISTRDLSADIRLFEIRPEGPFEPPSPGSHLQIVVSIGDRQETRSYSTVGPCADGLYRIAVKRLNPSRGGSAYMWTLKPGARLRVAMPRNHFPLAPRRPEYLLIAGGIGITPIYSMAMALKEAGASATLRYCARSAADLVLMEDLQAAYGDRLITHLDADNTRIDLDAAIAGLHPDGECYVCGPLGLMEAVRHAWARADRPASLLRFETFGNSGRFASEEFAVEIPRLQKSIRVAPHETLLEALEKAGVAMISDCRRGECGLCALPILSSERAVDHRDVFFSDAEKETNARLCTCVSRAAGGRLVLDTPDRVRA